MYSTMENASHVKINFTTFFYFYGEKGQVSKQINNGLNYYLIKERYALILGD